jgi:hypothetical protein
VEREGTDDLPSLKACAACRPTLYCSCQPQAFNLMQLEPQAPPPFLPQQPEVSQEGEYLDAFLMTCSI